LHPGCALPILAKAIRILPFREILRTLTCDLDAKWAAGEISRDHALRLWHRLPVVVEALVRHGRSLIDTFVPYEPLLGRSLAHAEIQPQLVSQLEDLAHRRQYAGVNQERIFEEYTDVLTQVSRQTPLMLILDDLHWPTLPSINLLFHLGRRMSGMPALILAAYRPEEFYQRQEEKTKLFASVLNEFQRLFGPVELRLELGSLVKDRQFVDELLDTEPNQLGEDFRAQLTHNTRGIPCSRLRCSGRCSSAGILFEMRPGAGRPAPQSPGTACRSGWRA
jgi:hypothetical protein